MDTFPYWKKSRRQAYLRIKNLWKAKVFFSLFKQKSVLYNWNDKLRRFYFIEFLPEIFSKIKPEEKWNNFIFEWEIKWRWFLIILKKCKKKESFELQLLSIYPN